MLVSQGSDQTVDKVPSAWQQKWQILSKLPRARQACEMLTLADLAVFEPSMANVDETTSTSKCTCDNNVAHLQLYDCIVSNILLDHKVCT